MIQWCVVCVVFFMNKFWRLFAPKSIKRDVGWIPWRRSEKRPSRDLSDLLSSSPLSCHFLQTLFFFCRLFIPPHTKKKPNILLNLSILPLFPLVRNQKYVTRDRCISRKRSAATTSSDKLVHIKAVKNLARAKREVKKGFCSPAQIWFTGRGTRREKA